MDVSTPKFRVRVDALVRDGKTGLPKFDSPETCPKGVKQLLTLQDIIQMDEETITKLGLLGVLEAINEELK